MSDILSPPAAVVPRRFIEGLSPSTPFAEAVELCFRQRWNAVLHYLGRVADRKEPLAEQIHRLRVSSRRFQAQLEALRDSLPAAEQRRLVRLARKICRAGARARSLEVRRVFLEQMIPTLSLEEAAAVELICERTMKRRNKAHKKLVQKAPQLAARLIKAGQALLAGLKSSRRSHDELTSFIETGSLAISRQLDAFWNRAARDRESPESLHQLRLAGKQLRYTLELFLPVLDRGFRDDFLPQLEHIQELLGEFHDAVETREQLPKQLRKWKRRFRRGVRKHNRFGSISWDGFRTGLDAISLACEQQAEHTRAEFQDMWPGFAGESFRIPVEHLLAQTFAECEAVAACRINTGFPDKAGLSIPADDRADARTAGADGAVTPRPLNGEGAAE
jgi:CHAD domain-containing protein